MSAQPFTWCGSSWSSFSLSQSAGCTCLCLVVCCTLAVCRHNTHRLSNTAPSRRNTACTTHRHEDAPSPQTTRHAQHSHTHHHRRSNATPLSEDRQTHANTHIWSMVSCSAGWLKTSTTLSSGQSRHPVREALHGTARQTYACSSTCITAATRGNSMALQRKRYGGPLFVIQATGAGQCLLTDTSHFRASTA